MVHHAILNGEAVVAVIRLRNQESYKVMAKDFLEWIKVPLTSICCE